MNDVRALVPLIQKRTEGIQKYLFRCYQDNQAMIPDEKLTYLAKFSTDTSLIKSVPIKANGEFLELDSDQILDLPAGIYHLEIWEVNDTVLHGIFPSNRFLEFVVEYNSQDLPEGKVSSLTLDEFIEQFKEATKGIKGQGSNADISIDVDKRTITINGKSLTIPEPINLSGLASKDDIAGLVNQTELAEYVKKNELPSIPNMTDYVKKEELPKQPDLTKYALKADLPDLTGYAKMSDLPSVTDLVKKSELANYAKKSDLPVIPDLTPFLKMADADKKFATKSEIPSLDGYARKTDLPKEPDLSNYATKDDLKTVTSNTTRHAPTAWTLDRTTNPWTIWFDNGCGIQFLDYSTAPTVYGYGFSVNTQNTNIYAWPLMGTIISASRGTLTLNNISKLHGSADYWGPNITVINPIKTDASNYDWSNVYFNDEDRTKSDNYRYNRQRNLFRVMYELGIWSIDDIKPFGLIKKEG